jgi:mannose-1-phosphate guanylyltransferase/D-glycero-alpha-D-manno-heptose 1-phosphate guanylyltransferase
MVVPSVENTERYGRVVLNTRDEIVEFFEKSSQTKGAGHINGGVYMFSKDFIKEMREGSYSFETEVLPAFVKRGLFGFETECPFIDIGIPEDYMRVSSFLRCPGFDNDNKQNPF